MDILNNIVARPGKEAASAQQTRADAPSQDMLKAFVNLLVSRNAQTAGTKDIAEKIARALEGSPADRAQMLKLIKETPGADIDTVLKNLADQLKTAPEVKPSLIPDLSANIATQLQESAEAADPEALLKTLQDKFTQIDGATPENLEAFREDAVKLMQSMGMAPEDMEAMFVKLAMSLQDILPGAQLTQLMMPVKPETLVKASTPAHVQKTSAEPVDMTPQQLAEQQLQSSAKSPVAHKAPTTATDPAKDARASQQQPAAPQPQQQSEAPAPKQQVAQGASNLALVNGFASDNSFSGGFSGGQYQQPGYALPAAPAGLQAPAASSGSFLNHMSSASGTTPTTQMIALQIQHNAQTQVDTFRMQLNPSELGQIEVRLKFGRDGSLKAHLIADKADTLNTLQKDQPQLQKMLQQAGLDVDDGALSFDLRQQHQERDTSQSFNNSRAQQAYGDDDDMMLAGAVQAKISVEAAGTVRQSGVNIMV